MTRKLLPYTRPNYPYHLYAPSWGLLVLSRYPLIEQPQTPETLRSQHILLKTPAGPISLWNIHTPTAIGQERWQIQKEMLTAISNQIQQTQTPLIALGDFNTSDQTQNYRLIAKHLMDVQQIAGQGLGFSFPKADVTKSRLPNFIYDLGLIRPIIRIDYIFVSHHFIPLNIHPVPDSLGSDHQPVVTTLGFAQP